jgi:hypothetical protein
MGERWPQRRPARGTRAAQHRPDNGILALVPLGQLAHLLERRRRASAHRIERALPLRHLDIG